MSPLRAVPQKCYSYTERVISSDRYDYAETSGIIKHPLIYAFDIYIENYATFVYLAILLLHSIKISKNRRLLSIF